MLAEQIAMNVTEFVETQLKMAGSTQTSTCVDCGQQPAEIGPKHDLGSGPPAHVHTGTYPISQNSNQAPVQTPTSPAEDPPTIEEASSCISALANAKACLEGHPHLMGMAAHIESHMNTAKKYVSGSKPLDARIRSTKSFIER